MTDTSDPVEEFARLCRNGQRPELERYLDRVSPMIPDQLVAILRIDQRERWRVGEKVSSESYFQKYPQVRNSSELAADLVYNEYLLGEKDDTAVQDLARRFPDLAETLDAQIQFHRAMTPPSTNPAPELPRQFGRYEIQRQLGRGGMGTVYLARDTQLDRLVALKVPNLEGDATQARQFLREARAAAALHHPNICPVFDSGEIAGRPFLTMAFVEGESLAARISRGPLPITEATALVRTLAEALAEAHRAGVVHRDLKSANILINSKGQPVITDFGLAKRFSAVATETSSGQGIIGTPAYMAPEQINGDTQAIGPATDIYALGVVLYELLTGTRPFDGPLGSLLARITTEDPEPPSRRERRVDANLDAVCRRAMAKRPADRFPSMTAFADALDAGRTSAPSIGQRRTNASRRPLMWGGLAAMVVVATIAGIAVILGNRATSPSTTPAKKDETPSASKKEPSPGPAPAVARERIRLIVPAYFPASGTGKKYWDSLVKSAPLVDLIVIANPQQGPGDATDPSLSGYFDQLIAAGSTPIGYVETNYGKRSIAEIKRDIDDWYRLYPKVGGIFFEEQSAKAEHSEMYAAAAKHIKSKSSLALVVSNPGDECAPEYLRCPDIDFVSVVIEAGNSALPQLPVWMTQNHGPKLASMQFGISKEVKRMEQRFQQLTRAGVHCLYLSDTRENDHFNRLPVWWEDLVRLAREWVPPTE